MKARPTKNHEVSWVGAALGRQDYPKEESVQLRAVTLFGSSHLRYRLPPLGPTLATAELGRQYSKLIVAPEMVFLMTAGVARRFMDELLNITTRAASLPLHHVFVKA